MQARRAWRDSEQALRKGVRMMGMGSEFLADHAFELQYPFGVASDVWTTKDGRQIAVKDMTTQHILNCMRIVGEDDGWYSVFESELEKRQVKAVIKMDERIEKATTDKPNEERLYTRDEVLCDL